MNAPALEFRLPFAAFAFVAILGILPGIQSAEAADKNAAPADSVSATDDAATDNAEASESGSAAAHELSVAPNEYPIFPEDRPDWVDSPGPQDEGSSVRWTIAPIPWSSREASESALRMQMRDALSQYAQREFNIDATIPREAIDDEWIETYLVDPARRYSGTVETADGVMYEDAVQLVFDSGVDQELKRQVEAIERQEREQVIGQRLRGLGAIGGLALLGMAGLSVLIRGASHVGRRRKR